MEICITGFKVHATMLLCMRRDKTPGCHLAVISGSENFISVVLCTSLKLY